MNLFFLLKNKRFSNENSICGKEFLNKDFQELSLED